MVGISKKVFLYCFNINDEKFEKHSSIIIPTTINDTFRIEKADRK